MMLRVFLFAALLVAAYADQHDMDDFMQSDQALATDPAMSAGDHGCCSAEDRREIQYVWSKVWASAFTDRKVIISRAIFHELFERYPEARALFSRVNIEHEDSPEYRAHLIRVTNGLDIMINLMGDPDVLFQQIEHLTNQHVARDGVKGVYMKGMVDAFDHILPQIAPCFNVEAWHRCFSKVTNIIASKLP